MEKDHLSELRMHSRSKERGDRDPGVSDIRYRNAVSANTFEVATLGVVCADPESKPDPRRAKHVLSTRASFKTSSTNVSPCTVVVVQ